MLFLWLFAFMVLAAIVWAGVYRHMVKVNARLQELNDRLQANEDRLTEQLRRLHELREQSQDGGTATDE